MREGDDYLWAIYRSEVRNGHENAVQKMNSAMVLYDPSLRDICQEDRQLRQDCFDHVSGDVSIQALFERIGELSRKGIV